MKKYLSMFLSVVVALTSFFIISCERFEMIDEAKFNEKYGTTVSTTTTTLDPSRVAPPTFFPKPDLFNNVKINVLQPEIAIGCATSGTFIYFVMTKVANDPAYENEKFDIMPTDSAKLYKDPIRLTPNVDTTVRIKARAFKVIGTMKPSELVEIVYNITWITEATTTTTLDPNVSTTTSTTTTIDPNSSSSTSSSSTTTTTTVAGAPVAGTSINFSNITSTGITVSWGKATDTVTLQTNLSYKLVRGATRDSVDTLEEADAVTSDRIIMDWTKNIDTFNVTGLLPNTDYWFAVIVKNEANAMALYTPQYQKTPEPVKSWQEILNLSVNSSTTAMSINAAGYPVIAYFNNDTRSIDVKEYNGSTWNSLSSLDSAQLPVTSGENIEEIKIIKDNGVYFLTYVKYDTAFMGSVYGKYSTTGSSWNDIGMGGFVTSGANHSLVVRNGIPYVTSVDMNYLSVEKGPNYDDNAGMWIWMNESAGVVSDALNGIGTSILLYDSVINTSTSKEFGPIPLYIDKDDNRIYGKCYGGNGWLGGVYSGASIFTTTSSCVTGAVDLTTTDGKKYLYVAGLNASNAIMVAKLTAIYSSSFVTINPNTNITATGFAGCMYPSLSLAIYDHVPYVLYQSTEATPRKLNLMKYNGTSWVNVGNANFTTNTTSDAVSFSLSISSSGVPYVIYQEVNSTTYVMKFE